MHVLKAFINLRCTFLRRSHWGSMHMQQNKLKLYAACRNYELDSRIPVSRLTMNCSEMHVRKSQALCIPPRENGGTAQAFCTPMMRIGDSFRLFALCVHPTHENWGTSQALCTTMMKIADSLRLCAPPVTKFVRRLRLFAPPS